MLTHKCPGNALYSVALPEMTLTNESFIYYKDYVATQ
jgi:hypothetical protein